VNLADSQLVEQIRGVTQGGSRLLVSLARRGKALQQGEPQRSAFLLAAVSTHPLYKGGRLAFDMMEIEDLILENPLVAPMSTEEVVQVLTSSGRRLIETLKQMVSSPAADRAMAGAGPDSDAEGLSGAKSSAAQSHATDPLLPRLSLGPTDNGKRPAAAIAAADQSRTTGNTYPELTSSDYLYDYVVLGFLDVLGLLHS
jgi:hypothetical protein